LSVGGGECGGEGGGGGGGGGSGGGGGVAVERAVAIAVAVVVVAVVVEIAVEVARSVAVAVDRAFATATAAVEGTGNNQPNYHIVVGDIDASLSLLFVTRRAFFLCRASYRCSVVGLDVNIFGGLDALSPLFVVRCRHHLCCRCHRRRRSCRRRPCRHRCRCRRRRHRSSSSSSLSRHHRCLRCCRHRVWLIVIFAVELHLLLPSPLPIASATTQCRYLIVLCCIAAAETSLIALPPLSSCLYRASWLLNCRHVSNQRHNMTNDVKKNHQKLRCTRHVGRVRLICRDDTKTCQF
jgi:hypothetical protein